MQVRASIGARGARHEPQRHGPQRYGPQRHGLWRKPAIRLAVGLAALGAITACAGHVEQRQGTEDRSYSTSVNLHLNTAKAALDRAHQAVGRGDFDAGLAEFQTALQSADAKPEHKAEALLGIGSVHGNMLNLKRDPQKALAAYRQLLHDFPDSKLRDQAEAGIRAIESSSGR